MAQQPLVGQGLHDHIWTRHTTLGRTYMDEWPARRRDLKNQNSHNRLPCPRRHSSPQSQQVWGRRPTPWTAWPPGLVREIY